MKFPEFKQARTNIRLAVNPMQVVSIRAIESSETAITTSDGGGWRVAASFDEVLAALEDALTG